MINKLLGLTPGILQEFNGHIVFIREDAQIFYVPPHLLPENELALPWQAARAGRVTIRAWGKPLEVVKGKYASFLTHEDWETSGLYDLVPGKLRRFLTGVIKTQGFRIVVDEVPTPAQTQSQEAAAAGSRDRGYQGEPQTVEVIDEDPWTTEVVYQPSPYGYEAEQDFEDWRDRTQQYSEPVEESPTVELSTEVDTEANWEFGFDEAQPYTVTDQDQGPVVDVGPNAQKTVGQWLFGRKQYYGPRSEPVSETPVQDAVDQADEFREELLEELAEAKRRLTNKAAQAARQNKSVDEVYSAIAELRYSINRLTDAQEYDGVLIRALLSNQNQNAWWQWAKWLSVIFFGMTVLWSFGTPLWGVSNRVGDQLNAWNEKLEQLDNWIPVFDWPKEQGK